MLLFDSWNWGKQELARLVELAGMPKTIVFYFNSIDLFVSIKGKRYKTVSQKKGNGRNY